MYKHKCRKKELSTALKLMWVFFIYIFVLFFHSFSIHCVHRSINIQTHTNKHTHTWWDDESCGNKCLWIVNKSCFKLFYIEKLEFHQFSVRALFSVDDGIRKYSTVQYILYTTSYTERMIERTSVQTNRRSMFLVGISVYARCHFFPFSVRWMLYMGEQKKKFSVTFSHTHQMLYKVYEGEEKKNRLNRKKSLSVAHLNYYLYRSCGFSHSSTFMYTHSHLMCTILL